MDHTWRTRQMFCILQSFCQIYKSFLIKFRNGNGLPFFLNNQENGKRNQILRTEPFEGIASYPVIMLRFIKYWYACNDTLFKKSNWLYTWACISSHISHSSDFYWFEGVKTFETKCMFMVCNKWLSKKFEKLCTYLVPKQN